jgi:hypothetical protein
LEPSIRPSRTCKAPQYYTDYGGADSKWKTDQVHAMAAIPNHSNFDPSDWTDIKDILFDLDHEATIYHYTLRQLLSALPKIQICPTTLMP